MMVIDDVIDEPSSSCFNGIYYVDDIDRNLMCVVCKQLLVNPIMIQACGHILCEFCVNHRLKPIKAVCPGGTTECVPIDDNTEVSTYSPAILQINKLMVYCKYYHCGCKETMMSKDYRDHTEGCSHRTICEYCDKPVRDDLMTEHHKICDEAPTTCILCEDETTNGKLDEHKSTCRKEKVKCIFAYAGCDLIDDREKMMGHEKTSHVKVLADYAQKTNNMVEELKKNLHTITDANCVLQSELVDLIRSVNDVKERTSGGQIQTVVTTASAASSSYGGNPPPYNEAMNSVFQSTVAPAIIPMDVDKKFGEIETFMNSLQARVELCETVSRDGILIWTIDNYSAHYMRATTTDTTNAVRSIFSEYFYTHLYGYKLRLRLFPNGDGLAKDKNMSLFFQIVRDEFSNIQKWPFDRRVTLSLMSQETGTSDIEMCIQPDPRNSSYQRPISACNIANGLPFFAERYDLRPNGPYCKDDKIVIKARVFQ